MPIKMSLGDFGSPVAVSLYPLDGVPLGPSDYSGASFNALLSRTDSLALPMDDSETVIYIQNKRKVDYYRTGQTLRIGNEIMTVGLVDYANGAITVSRGAIPLAHRRGSLITSIVYESATLITYNTLAKTIFFTAEVGMFPGAGVYRMEVEIDTLAGRHVSVVDANYATPLTVEVFQDTNGS